MSQLDADRKLHLLEVMLLSREGDRREGILIRQGKGWFHIGGLGHEALAALSLLLQEQDYLFPHYRDRALVLARGLSNRDLARNFHAKRASTSGGRQLPGHYSSRKHNIWSMPSPTGSNLLPACGVAWGLKLDGQDGVVFAHVGDAGMRQGEFYEAAAFALQLQLPVVFVIEDNGYGISTKTHATNPLRLGLFHEDRILRSDGRKVDSVFQSGREALSRIRSGAGPVILWLELDRLSSHSSSDDQRLYRSADDIEGMLQRDPVDTLAAQLIDEGVLSPEDWEQRKRLAAARVEQDYRETEAEADPKPEETLDQLALEAVTPTSTVGNPEEEPRMLDAVNRVFRDALQRDRGVLFFGEDVEDPMGGVFKLTNGLSTDFADRVFNSPLAEATILGVGCGLASYGKHPVFELQFIDFVGPAWNQLVNNIATLRWRTMGEWNCPMVIYAPYGAYLPGGGPWHSQSNEAAFAHVPGLKVVVPSTPEDAAGLVQTAIHAADPVLVLLPKHLLRARMKSQPAWPALPFGKARVRRAGSEVTLVAWGNCVEKAEAAIAEVGEAVSVELIDLRSIVPWDREAIIDSLRTTGRLLVVEEDNRTCSFGQTLVSEIIQDAEAWESLVQPPVLISRDDVHIGFNPIYEEACLPSVSEIVRAILGLTGAGVTPTLAAGSHVAVATRVKTTAKVVPIRVPAIGEGLEEARVLKFFKKPGENVARDELIYQLETDKAVVDIESPHSGVLKSWDAQEETSVRIGSVIGTIEPVSEAEIPAVEAAPLHHAESIPSPVKSVAPTPSHLPFEETTLSPQQQILAARLTRAARVAVPATIFHQVRWEAIEAARAYYKQTKGAEEITTFTLVAWCVKEALVRHSQFRSSLPQNNLLRVYKNVNLGIAVSLPGDDLTTAVVEQAELLGLKEFARRLKERVELARSGQDQVRQQVSLIITSMASFDIPQGIPVIVPPAVATLLVNAPVQDLQWVDGAVRPRSLVNLALTIDHRVINGASAAKFLNEVKTELEQFSHLKVAL
jgi:2-oxoisovalerate dehydrogenase E1 component